MLCAYVSRRVSVRAVAVVYIGADVFYVESTVLGVEARHEGFEAWNDAGHDRNVKCSLRPYVEVR